MTLIAIVGLAFLLGGLAKGVVGMGLPTVSIAILGTALGPHEALPLMVVPALLTNMWQAAIGGHFRALFRRFWPLLLAGVPGIWLGVWVLVASDPRLMNAALGVALCLYGVSGLAAFRLSVPAAWESRLGPIIGAATGIVTGMTGTIVMPVVLYFEALGLEKNALVQAMGLSFAVSTLALGLILASNRAYDLDQLAISTLALIPAIAGMIAGQWLRQRISPPAFRRWIFVTLIVLGANLMAQLVG